LPLAHIFERIFSAVAIYIGLEVYYFGGDILKITVDMADAKPTIFLGVPRLFNKIYDNI